MVAVTSEALENSPDNPGTNASCTDETNNGPIQISNWQNILLVRQILMLVMNDRSHASLQVCKKPFTRKHSKTQFPFAVGESCALVSVNTANHSEHTTRHTSFFSINKNFQTQTNRNHHSPDWFAVCHCGSDCPEMRQSFGW